MTKVERDGNDHDPSDDDVDMAAEAGTQYESRPVGDDVNVVIPYRNPPALVAYYLGLFSVIPCFALGLVALVLGILGLRKAAREPRARGRVHAWIGILGGAFFGIGYLIITIIIIAVALSDM